MAKIYNRINAQFSPTSDGCEFYSREVVANESRGAAEAPWTLLAAVLIVLNVLLFG
jgi:hypothetical protein